ncbi:MAG: hypothetical protein AB1429_09940, partial [Pseudomonadota bacterium]
GGAQVAAARSAAGAIPPAGSTPPAGGSGPGGGSGGGSGPGPADFARAPVSSTVQTLRTAADRLTGAGRGTTEDAPPPPPPPSETIARAEARRGGVGDLARGATAAAAQHEEGGPGMSATPSRDPSDPEA